MQLMGPLGSHYSDKMLGKLWKGQKTVLVTKPCAVMEGPQLHIVGSLLQFGDSARNTARLRPLC